MSTVLAWIGAVYLALFVCVLAFVALSEVLAQVREWPERRAIVPTISEGSGAILPTIEPDPIETYPDVSADLRPGPPLIPAPLREIPPHAPFPIPGNPLGNPRSSMRTSA